MSNVRTTAGSTLGVSATLPATFDEAGYAALTFTLVGEITNIGEFGKVFNLVTHNPIGTRQTIKRKGSYNNGTLSLAIGRDETDAGQLIMKAAAESDNSYAFAITLQDLTVFYTTAQVFSFTNVLGGVDDITAHNAQVELDRDIIEVIPS